MKLYKCDIFIYKLQTLFISKSSPLTFPLAKIRKFVNVNCKL